jgi:hypothetical protein
MIGIKGYEEKYAKEMAKKILDNLYTINIKEQGNMLLIK